MSRLLARIERGLLFGTLAALVGLAFFQIAGRLIARSSPDWMDELLRHLVLWVGLLGALAASKERRHITIDAVQRWVPPRGRRVLGVVTGLFSAAVCLALAHATFRFVLDERLYSGDVLPHLPAWIAQAPIPVAFLVMAWRFAGTAWTSARQAWKGMEPDGAEAGAGGGGEP